MTPRPDTIQKYEAALSMTAAAEELRRKATHQRYLAIALTERAARLEERAARIERRAEQLTKVRSS
jgi:hypothetical protein